MKNSVWMALVATLAVVLWLFSGRFSEREKSQTAYKTQKPLMSVAVMDSKAVSIKREIIVQGRLEVFRNIGIRAETKSVVQSLVVEKGAVVVAGQLLLKLQEKDRNAQIAKTTADIASKRLLVNAMSRLKQRGLQAETNLKQAQADLEAAKAEKLRLQLDLSDTEIRSPIDGIVESRDVELGSYVDIGDSLATIIDIHRLKAVAYATQQNFNLLKPGQKVLIRLLDGRDVDGELKFISKEADSSTRSYRIEAEFDNAELEFAAGASAELHIIVGEISAHLVSAAALNLDEKGQLGVKTLDDDNRVIFNPVSRVKAESDGIWITGLPEQARIITLGHGFVLPGEQVKPVER